MTQTKRLSKISEIHKSFQSIIQMSYDIAKAHGGELKVEAKQREATVFSISFSVVLFKD